MSNAVFITVPKYVAINTNNAALPKLRPAPSPSSGYASSGAEDAACNVPKAKKRRLDHLSWEEKVQRKKLKNRVAAQTSRDRKKARMEEMEFEIKDLTDKTNLLENKCESLQSINDSLLNKNHKLDLEVENLRQQLNELKEQQKQQLQQQQQQSTIAAAAATTACAGCASILNGSAVSKNTDPLQQGSITMDTQSTRDEQQQQQLKKSNTLASLWRIVALCLLYKTCYSTPSMTTKNSMRDDLKSWPKVCSQISQQTWKQALERAMKMLPKLQASQSDCLDQWWGPQQSAWNPAEIEMMA